MGQRLGQVSEPQVHEATASAPRPPLNPPSLAPGARYDAIAIAIAIAIATKHVLALNRERTGNIANDTKN